MHSKAPKQYQQGWTEFYKLKFKVTPDVLIPRPETELLVDEVLNRIKDNITVVDLGTGSGNIAISIVKNAPNIKIIAIDISQKALKVAQKNAKLHGVLDKIQFIKSDLLSNLNYTLYPKRYPLIIVTNLPYIPSSRIPHLDSSVKDFEPHLALDGGSDGFKIYRKLFAQIVQQKLKPQLVIGEIDYTHGQLAVQEAQKYFPEASIEVKTDLSNKQRILIIH